MIESFGLIIPNSSDWYIVFSRGDNRFMIKNGVVLVLEGDSSRLIDEWQALGFF